MSLLLDALQRASQEKEKLAESRASADRSSQNGVSSPKESFPSLETELESSPPPPLRDIASFGPEFTDSTTQPEISPSPVDPAETQDSQALISPVEAMESSGPAPRVPTESAELTLDPFENPKADEPPGLEYSVPERLEPEVSAEPANPIEAKTESPPVHNIQHVAEPAVAAIAPNPAPASRSGAEAFVKTEAQAHPSPVASAQVAREILGATAKTSKQGPSRRLIMLGVFALLIAIANAAFFLGYMDNLLGLSSQELTPVASITPVTTPQASQVSESVSDAVSESPNRPAVEAEASAALAVAKPSSMPGSEQRSATGQDDISSPAQAAKARQKSASRAASAKTVQPVFVAKPAALSDLDSGYSALTDGRFDDATEAYNRALLKNPAEPDALLGLAYIAQRKGLRDEARSYYQRVLRQDPGHPVASAGLLSLAAEGDLQITTSRAREMAERNPNSAVVLSMLAGLLAKEGRIAEAQQAYFKALTLEPQNALHAYNLAVALDRMHKYGSAQTYYQRALVLADKLEAAGKADFPRNQALQRLEQLRAKDGDVPAPSQEKSSGNGRG